MSDAPQHDDSVPSAIKAYLRHLKASGRSDATLVSYRAKLKLLAELLDVPRLYRITEPMLEKALLAVRDGHGLGYSRNLTTMNQIRSVAKGFFHWCRETGRKKSNPAALLKQSKASTQPTVPIRPDEIVRLFAALAESQEPLAPRDKALFALYAYAGLRRREALRLEPAHILLDESTIYLCDTKTGAGQRRFMPKILGTIIAPYLAAQAGSRSRWLFPGRNPEHPLADRQAADRFLHWRTQSGLPDTLTIHSLRAGFATRLYAVTQDALLVSKALGHVSAATVSRYIGIDDTQIADAIRHAFDGLRM